MSLIVFLVNCQSQISLLIFRDEVTRQTPSFHQNDRLTELNFKFNYVYYLEYTNFHQYKSRVGLYNLYSLMCC